jgi:hypothetical protein
MIDDGWGFEWDRVIAYIKDPEIFVVFDIVKARVEEYFTMANLWHTRRIVEQGDHWYDTVYDQIGSDELPENRHLLIYFPDTHFRLEGTETETRHYQTETLIHQTTAHHFELGETEGFVTVLVPHEAGESPESWVERIRLIEPVPARTGLGVVIEDGEKTITVGVKQDLRMDIARDWRRPRYTYEAGRIQFDQVETNGDFVFASLVDGELNYTITNLTKATYGEQVLYEGRPSYFYLAFVEHLLSVRGFSQIGNRVIQLSVYERRKHKITVGFDLVELDPTSFIGVTWTPPVSGDVHSKILLNTNRYRFLAILNDYPQPSPSRNWLYQPDPFHP